MTTSAKILKSGSVSELLVSGQYNFEDLKQRCEAYLDSVREQSQKLLKEAQQEIDQKKAAAVKEGQQTGLELGLKQAAQQLQQKIEKQAEQLTQQRLKNVLPILQQAAEQLSAARQELQLRWEQQALQLMLKLCGKLTRQQIAIDAQVFQHRIAEVLPYVLGSQRVKLRVCPSDLAALQLDENSIVQLLAEQTDVDLKADPSLSSGDFLIETDQGKIDARLDTQLERIARELLGITDQNLSTTEPGNSVDE